MRLRQQRQTAFGDEVDASGRYRFLDRVHDVIESDAEVRIVPANQRTLELSKEKSQVSLQHIEVQRLIRDHRIDAKAAGVWASKAADHRNHLYQRRFLKGRL